MRIMQVSGSRIQGLGFRMCIGALAEKRVEGTWKMEP